MIKNTNQINKQQLQELKQLADLCKKTDGSIPNLYTHILTQQRAFPASLLYYEQGQLIGFLSAYFFYDEAVEISILVHPDHRNKGIAIEMTRRILPLIQLQNYFIIIFSAPAHLHNKWLTAYNYAYLHSEYFMERSDLNPILEYNPTLTFRPATSNDIPELCMLDELCFPQKHGDLPNRLQHVLDDREYLLMLALQGNIIIGKAHLRWQAEGATLSDIAIHPSMQGKGFGTALIAHCINHALSEGKPKLNLDVETHNQRALNLYTRLGFVTQNACDFWSIDIEKLLHIFDSEK